MKEWLKILAYIAVGIFFFWAAIYFNGKANERCIEKGGQIIRHNTEIGDLCILPPGKR